MISVFVYKDINSRVLKNMLFKMWYVYWYVARRYFWYAIIWRYMWPHLLYIHCIDPAPAECAFFAPFIYTKFYLIEWIYIYIIYRFWWCIHTHNMRRGGRPRPGLSPSKRRRLNFVVLLSSSSSCFGERDRAMSERRRPFV